MSASVAAGSAVPMFVFAAVFSGTSRLAVGEENSGGALSVIALITGVAATARLLVAGAVLDCADG